jgi:hypothetical protein
VALVAGCGQHVPNRPSSAGEAAQAPAAADQRITLSNTDEYDALLALPGVVGVGTTFDGAGHAQLVAMVERATVGLPARLSGVTVMRLVTGEFRPFALTGTYRPAPIGVSVGNANECLPGTIGHAARHRREGVPAQRESRFCAAEIRRALGEANRAAESGPDCPMRRVARRRRGLVIAHLSELPDDRLRRAYPEHNGRRDREVASPSDVSLRDTSRAFYTASRGATVDRYPPHACRS